jgi:transcriptional regulator with XRE-family HTH domain
LVLRDIFDNNQLDDNKKKTQFGIYVQKLRKERQLKLKEVANYLGVSVNFVSLVERGEKNPSDIVLRKYAKLFNINEDVFFDMLGKIPLSVKEQLQNHKGLRSLLSEISKVDKELQNELIEEVYKVYMNFLKRHNLMKGEKD